MITIFSDGACSGNPGPAGWGWVILTEDGTLTEGFGHAIAATNNHAELMGALEALESLPWTATISCPSCKAVIGACTHQSPIDPHNKAFCPVCKESVVPKVAFHGQTVRLYSDSRYVVNGMENWIVGWAMHGWKTASGDPVKNAELWKRLMRVNLRHCVDWCWTKGHTGKQDAISLGNQRADQLAVQGKEKAKKTLLGEA